MITCTITIHIAEAEIDTLRSSIRKFSKEASACGVSVELSTAPSDGKDAAITINVDDERIMAMKGAKRGPKEKTARISVEEMRSLRDSGVPSKEIAAIAGIGVATYFRRMAGYGDAASENRTQGGGDR